MACPRLEVFAALPMLRAETDGRLGNDGWLLADIPLCKPFESRLVGIADEDEEEDKNEGRLGDIGDVGFTWALELRPSELVGSTAGTGKFVMHSRKGLQ